ncbi:MAG: CapA family protein [Clostridia bacterium]|jgi:poly-gamma-glutamate capsule biosynthesis protein CapA/YwtB (metallophosphatase superfamily)|nr:CapA family protein [Clostridia bacterium]
MKKSYLFICFILILLLGANLTGCKSEAISDSVPVTAPEPVAEKTFTIAAVGDILMHNTLLRAAYQRELYKHDFSPFFARIKPHLEAADFVIGNLETTLGVDFNEFGGYPRFNSPAVLAENLKEAGFDLVTTANNHCLDKGIKGLNNTLDYLDKAGLLHVGTARTLEEKEKILITEIQGVKTAVLAYTYGTNGLPIPKGKEYAVNLLDEKEIINDLYKAREQGAQLIILCLHFGQEYHDHPNSAQIRLAKMFFKAGADVILGTHPHVLQPSEIYYERADKAQFVIYSLGNFISDQNGLPRKSSMILNLHFGIDPVTGDPYFKEATSVPIWTWKYQVNDKLKFEVIPLEETIEEIKAGKLGGFTLDDIQEMQQAWVHVSAFTQPLSVSF